MSDKCDQPNTNNSGNNTPRMDPNNPQIIKPEKNMPEDRSSKGQYNVNEPIEKSYKKKKSLGSFKNPESKSYEEIYLEALRSNKEPDIVREVENRDKKDPETVGETYDRGGKRYLDIKDPNKRDGKDASDINVPQTRKYKFGEVESEVVHRTKEENTIEIDFNREVKHTEESFNTKQSKKDFDSVIVPTNRRGDKFSDMSLTTSAERKENKEVEDRQTTSSPKINNESDLSAQAPVSSYKNEDLINTPSYIENYKIFNEKNVGVDTPLKNEKNESDINTTIKSTEKTEVESGVKDPGLEKSEEEINPAVQVVSPKSEIESGMKDPGLEKREEKIEPRANPISPKTEVETGVKDPELKKGEEIITENANINEGSEKDKPKYSDDAQSLESGAIEYNGENGYRVSVLRENQDNARNKTIKKVDQSGEAVDWNGYPSGQSSEFNNSVEPQSVINKKENIEAINQNSDYSQTQNSRYGQSVRAGKYDGVRDDYTDLSNYSSEPQDRERAANAIIGNSQKQLNRNSIYYTTEGEIGFNKQNVERLGPDGQIASWVNYSVEGDLSPSEINNETIPTYVKNNIQRPDFENRRINYSLGNWEVDKEKTENNIWTDSREILDSGLYYSPEDRLSEEEVQDLEFMINKSDKANTYLKRGVTTFESNINSTPTTLSSRSNRNYDYSDGSVLEIKSDKIDGTTNQNIDWNNYIVEQESENKEYNEFTHSKDKEDNVHVPTNMVFSGARDTNLKEGDDQSQTLEIDKLVAKAAGYLKLDGTIDEQYEVFKQSPGYKALKQHITDMRNGEAENSWDIYYPTITNQESSNFKYEESYLLTHRQSDNYILTENSAENFVSTSKKSVYNKAPETTYWPDTLAAVFSKDESNSSKWWEKTKTKIDDYVANAIDEGIDGYRSIFGDPAQNNYKVENISPEVFYRNTNFDYTQFFSYFNNTASTADKNSIFEIEYDVQQGFDNQIASFFGLGINDYGSNDYNMPGDNNHQLSNRDIYYDVKDHFLDIDFATQVTTAMSPEFGRTINTLQSVGNTIGDIVGMAQNVGALLEQNNDKYFGNISNEGMTQIRKGVFGEAAQRIGAWNRSKEIYNPAVGFDPTGDVIDRLNDTVRDWLNPIDNVIDRAMGISVGPGTGQKEIDKLTRGVSGIKRRNIGPDQYYYTPPEGAAGFDSNNLFGFFNSWTGQELFYGENIALSPSSLGYNGSIQQQPYKLRKSKFAQYRAKAQSDMFHNYFDDKAYDGELYYESDISLTKGQIQNFLDREIKLQGLGEYETHSPYSVSGAYKESLLNNLIVEYEVRDGDYVAGWNINYDRFDNVFNLPVQGRSVGGNGVDYRGQNFTRKPYFDEVEQNPTNTLFGVNDKVYRPGGQEYNNYQYQNEIFGDDIDFTPYSSPIDLFDTENYSDEDKASIVKTTPYNKAFDNINFFSVDDLVLKRRNITTNAEVEGDVDPHFTEYFKTDQKSFSPGQYLGLRGDLKEKLDGGEYPHIKSINSWGKETYRNIKNSEELNLSDYISIINDSAVFYGENKSFYDEMFLTTPGGYVENTSTNFVDGTTPLGDNKTENYSDPHLISYNKGYTIKTPSGSAKDGEVEVVNNQAINMEAFGGKASFLTYLKNKSTSDNPTFTLFDNIGSESEGVKSGFDYRPDGKPILSYITTNVEDTDGPNRTDISHFVPQWVEPEGADGVLWRWNNTVGSEDDVDKNVQGLLNRGDIKYKMIYSKGGSDQNDGVGFAISHNAQNLEASGNLFGQGHGRYTHTFRDIPLIENPNDVIDYESGQNLGHVNVNYIVANQEYSTNDFTGEETEYNPLSIGWERSEDGTWINNFNTPQKLVDVNGKYGKGNNTHEQTLWPIETAVGPIQDEIQSTLDVTKDPAKRGKKVPIAINAYYSKWRNDADQDEPVSVLQEGSITDNDITGERYIARATDPMNLNSGLADRSANRDESFQKNMNDRIYIHFRSTDNSGAEVELDRDYDNGSGGIIVLKEFNTSYNDRNNQLYTIPFQFEAELSGETRQADYATETAIGRTSEFYIWSKTNTRTLQLKTKYVVTTGDVVEKNQFYNWLDYWNEDEVIKTINMYRTLLYPMSKNLGNSAGHKLSTPSFVITGNKYLLTASKNDGKYLSRWIAQDVNIDPVYEFGYTNDRTPMAYDISMTLKEVFSWNDYQSFDSFAHHFNFGE